ncbi:type IV toxin-antitoxin system AbiEi family antitoxin [Microbacterium sp. Marseille-Q6965]|uniref:type IV toxin-antitoxin system AbiEi family antitoxin n=1 Tax=Microbacterium sp. Marseille-Q6965 TaxID=2965072 RepID=UPI0021B81A7D|nr:type IV toxin-antitoxin system AbiEi family antitoxin [Microbacterium sp. Marseille-Q6965]
MRIYFATAGALSAAELRAAALDGDLVPLGSGWVPADAIQTPALRAASLAPLLRPGLAAVGLTAAWIHGALATLPQPCQAQRATAGGGRRVGSGRLRIRDALLPVEEQQEVGGVRVSTPARTLVDLTGDEIVGGGAVAARAEALSRLAGNRTILADAAALAQRRARMPRRPEILRRLRAQEEVTR